MLVFASIIGCWNNYIDTCTQVRRNLIRLPLAVAALLLSLHVSALEIDTPAVGLTGVGLDYVVAGAEAGAELTLAVGGNTWPATADAEGAAYFKGVTIVDPGVAIVTVSSDGRTASAELRVIPGWISTLPALLAIGVALTIRNVIPALLLGLWVGSTALQSFTLIGAGRGLLDSFQVFVTKAIADFDRASIILFTMMIGGMVGIITRNGGMASVVKAIVSRAKTAVGGQVAVWLMGLMIFFDDYSNTLVVGNTARSLTDHLKISREKLAYIVDSTAAPVACIALITTWIGYEIGLVDQALKSIDELAHIQAYSVFVHSIPYSFYPILAIIFVFMISASGRDFGPMLKAEIRARNGAVKPEMAEALPAIHGDELEPKDRVPLRTMNAFVPIISLIVALLISLYMLGDVDRTTPPVDSRNRGCVVRRTACDALRHDHPRPGVVALGPYRNAQHGGLSRDAAGRFVARSADSRAGVHSCRGYGVHDGHELGHYGDPDAAHHPPVLGRHGRERDGRRQRDAYHVLGRGLLPRRRRMGRSLLANLGYDRAVVRGKRL